MLEIVKIPIQTLRERSLEVTRNFLMDSDTQKLIDEMVPTMYDDDGIGLAAPQVGQNIRICVIGKDADIELNDDLILINPIWSPKSRKKNVDVEGCLSVPGIFGKVKRYTNIDVSAWDRHGAELHFEAKNFFARVVQHEVDHLNGVLFIDKARDIYESGDKKQM
jgi:peptide deformylase